MQNLSNIFIIIVYSIAFKGNLLVYDKKNLSEAIFFLTWLFHVIRPAECKSVEKGPSRDKMSRRLDTFTTRLGIDRPQAM